jgi:hypothetical protein
MRGEFEKYNRSISDNIAPTPAAISEEEVASGVETLVINIRQGFAERLYPPGSRLVIGDLVWEVVDHDTVVVNDTEHTMTLRLFTRDYLEKVFDKVKGYHSWTDSALRAYLNQEFASTYICQPLRDVILPVCNTQLEVVRTKVPCECGCGCEECEHVQESVTTVSCVDTVWLPSVSQLGFDYEYGGDVPEEGAALDAFNPSLTLVRKGRVIVAEYLGDTIAHKMYWTRSSRWPTNGDQFTYKVDWKGDLVEEKDAYETTAMVVPFITIG